MAANQLETVKTARQSYLARKFQRYLVLGQFSILVVRQSSILRFGQVKLIRFALVFIEPITQFEYLGTRIFIFGKPLGLAAQLTRSSLNQLESATLKFRLNKALGKLQLFDS
jgi:hypothetical protein